ncbi:MAG: element excision factor XisI family protein [Blastocatellia bacterium]
MDGTTFSARIRDGKFLIEEDWTEGGIATELVGAGVPKENIVLAFNEPEMRASTEFAVAQRLAMLYRFSEGASSG